MESISVDYALPCLENTLLLKHYTLSSQGNKRTILYSGTMIKLSKLMSNFTQDFYLRLCSNISKRYLFIFNWNDIFLLSYTQNSSCIVGEVKSFFVKQFTIFFGGRI